MSNSEMILFMLHSSDANIHNKLCMSLILLFQIILLLLHLSTHMLQDLSYTLHRSIKGY